MVWFFLSEAGGQSGFFSCTAFDVDEYGGCNGFFAPYSLLSSGYLEDNDIFLTNLSEMGLELYDASNKTNYQFVKVIKVVSRDVSCAEYYISFEAKDESSDTSATLQTLAYFYYDNNVSVSYCKKKGDPIPKVTRSYRELKPEVISLSKFARHRISISDILKIKMIWENIQGIETKKAKAKKTKRMKLDD